jgi:hypothetical protein
VNSPNGLDIAYLDSKGYKLAKRQQDLTPLQRDYLLEAYPKLDRINSMNNGELRSLMTLFGGASGGNRDDTEEQMRQKVKARRG